MKNILKYTQITGVLLFLIIISMSNSCNKKTEDTDKYAKLIVEDQLTVNTQLFEFARKYVDMHPRFDTFVIMESKMCNEKKADSYLTAQHRILRGEDYYVIGPAFEYLFFQKDLPFCYFTYSNKKIFIKTGFEKLLDQNASNISGEYIEKQIDISLSNDSIYSTYAVEPPGLGPFLFHGTLFTINKKDIVVVSNRPDTIFLPPPPIVIRKGISDESIH